MYPDTSAGMSAVDGALRQPHSLRGARLQSLHSSYLNGRHRPLHALEHQFAERLDVGERLDRHLHLAVDQNLATARFGAEPRGEVHHRADRRIIVSPLEADTAERCIAMGDPYSEAEVVAELAPLDREIGDRVAHLDRHSHRTHRRIGAWQWIIEQDVEAVAGKALQCTLVLVDERTKNVVIRAQDRHHLLRLGGLGEGPEAAQVAKHGRPRAAMALQVALAIPRGHHEIRDLRRETPPQTAPTLDSRQPVAHPLLDGL